MSCCHNPNENNLKCKCMSCRVEKLEKDNDEKFDVIKNKLIEFETELNIVKSLGSRAFHSKKPHKYPVCDGSGMDQTNLAPGLEKQFIISIDCRACEGKGIVWK